MNTKEYKERLQEVKLYNAQIFDMTVAEKHGYSLLGGSREVFLSIKKAIEEVLNDLYKETQERLNNPKDIPQEFKNFNDEKVIFDLLRISVLIKLLKKKGNLRTMLGKEKEKQLYDDFIVRWEDGTGATSRNPYSILGNCLISVIEETKENEKTLSQVNTENIRYRTGHLQKKEAFVALTPKYLDKPIVKQNKDVLENKINSGLTIREHITKNMKKYLHEPIDVFEFKHKIRNLGRTHAELHPESIIRNEVEVRISSKEFTEYMTGKPYSSLQTRSKNKVKDMLYKLREDDFLFLEKVDGKLTVPFGKLYRYDICFLPDGTQAYTLYINLSDQDFRSNKNYVYLDDNDFKLNEQAELKFWKKFEGRIPKIGSDRIKRVENNKIFQAAQVKCQQFCRANYQTEHPLILHKETFDMTCGDIRAEAKRLVGENKPRLSERVVNIVRWKVLWIARDELKWAYEAGIKDDKVIIKPNPKAFTGRSPHPLQISKYQ
ncbi:MAG: hypothetical protein LBJ98_02660 [Endomicrobium sp.]|jgi:hypothetical protein|nr:hypothetical protein [Endomicrobium sp.]